MIIRKATSSDSGTIAMCLLLAMKDIVYKFIGEEDFDKALSFMRYFVSKEFNQYSWQNCWIVENDGSVIAAVNVYDGSQLHQLRQPVIDYIQTTFNRHVSPEDETQAGEYYIDSLGVLPEHRCKGIGSKLLQFLVDEYFTRRNHTLGLLVDDENNPDAKSLYLKVGFKSSGRKVLLGKSLEHLQFGRIGDLQSTAPQHGS